MKSKNLLIIALLLLQSNFYAQQIGDGFGTHINDVTIPMGSGAYNAFNPTGKIPDEGWQHLFIVRHPNPNNNYQLQIGSSISQNDKLYFRKLASGAATAINPDWIELATRGSNSFIGNQSISGNLGIGTSTPSNIQGWSKVLDVAGINHSKILATAENALYKVGIFSHNQAWYGGGGFVGTESNHPLHVITNYNVKMSVLTNGNVGIGTTTPDSKLSVKGIVHSQEVKVDMNGWSDFVFKKEYNLPTLEDVEKHIVEKGHLENIPSEAEVLKNGINLGEMNTKLLQKIEEMTLYMIEMKKEIETLKRNRK